jgi:hypothetical protein
MAWSPHSKVLASYLEVLDQEQLPEAIVRMIETRGSAGLSDLDRFLLFPE